MRMPKRPPSLTDLQQTVAYGPERLITLLAAGKRLSVRGKYLHWDELRYRTPPEGLSHNEWWFALKVQRMSAEKHLPLADTSGRPFSYVEADPIPEQLHRIDQQAGGSLLASHELRDSQMKRRYIVSSLIEEAITSSQIEGAATTRRVAKEMIRSGRRPRDRNEQMILNNYQTMQRIADLKGEILSRDLVFDIHRMITGGTMKFPSEAGRFRRNNESVHVAGNSGEVLYVPPPADQLEERMQAMCDFANGSTPESFIHPVLRSVILHFWLAYDHPFVDGNGRTARALFYWSMLRHDFWLFEFIPISRTVRKARSKYYRTFLYTETDENDLTYFILYHLDIVTRSIRELHDYVKRKTAEREAIERELGDTADLNLRQLALIKHALGHPRQVYTIRSHQSCHAVAHRTARTDLFGLHELGLLDVRKSGRTYCFTPASGLEEKLGAIG